MAPFNSWWIVPRISYYSRRNFVVYSRWFHEACNAFTRSSEKVKKLTLAICEMIARATANQHCLQYWVLNLLREAEPQYSVLCWTTITRNLNDLCTSEKQQIRVLWQVLSVSAVWLICAHHWVEMVYFPHLPFYYFRFQNMFFIIYRPIILQGHTIMLQFCNPWLLLLMIGVIVLTSSWWRSQLIMDPT